MPESKGRKAAEDKAVAQRKSEAKQASAESRRKSEAFESPTWLVPLFVGVGLLGVMWLVLYYVASQYIPFLGILGGWNVVIGMGLMAISFAIATQWK